MSQLAKWPADVRRLYWELERDKEPIKKTLLSLLAVKDAGIGFYDVDCGDLVDHEYNRLLYSHGFIDIYELMRRTVRVDEKLGLPNPLLNRDAAAGVLEAMLPKGKGGKE